MAAAAERALAARVQQEMLEISLAEYDSVVLSQLAVMQQYRLLKHRGPGGVYVLPESGNVRRWQGVIFVRDGPFAGLVARFSMLIPDEFPADGALPSVQFQEPVPWHPLVNHRTGELSLCPLLIPAWRADTPLSAALEAIRNALTPTSTDMETWCKAPSDVVANADAAKMWRTDRDEFLNRAELDVVSAAAKLESSDSSASSDWTFPTNRPGLDRLEEFLLERPRRAEEIFAMIESLPRVELGGGGSVRESDPDGARQSGAASSR